MIQVPVLLTKGLINVSFSDKSKANPHRFKPKPNRSFFCGYCHKFFDRISSLTRHERIHTGEKPYSCDICGRKFGDPSACLKHQRLHGVRPYTCLKCGKFFTEQPHFINHEVICNKTDWSNYMHTLSIDKNPADPYHLNGYKYFTGFSSLTEKKVVVEANVNP